ncbi:MAG: pyridoxamine 5'-phosphate oxidase family protein [Methylobacteriaceae bacterium]|nr:pyridoxamine 5'-phosphate oxidase family protein [Methylobacteriaceae bacterium]
MSAPPRLTEAVRQDIRRSVLCWLATVDAAGQPNVSPKEVFCAQGEEAILIADIASPGSVSNIRGNPQVCVSFIDVFRQKGWKVAGAATIIGRDEAGFEAIGRELIAMAGPSFPVRHVIRLTPQRISRILAPSYAIFPDRTEEERMAEIYRLYGVRPIGGED